MLSNNSSRQIKSVQTAFELINILQKLGGATPKEITNRLELSKSSVHNYLSTLETNGYIVNESGVYRLGLRCLTHGITAKRLLNVEKYTPIVQKISKEFSLLTWLVGEENGRGFFLDSSLPDSKENIYGSMGKRSYLHSTAAGKAMLALCSDEYLEQLVERHGLPEFTTRTITDMDSLSSELAEIRERGYAVSQGESVLGIFSIAVAFQDSDRLFAVSVFGKSRNFNTARSNSIGKRLVENIDASELEIGGELK